MFSQFRNTVKGVLDFLVTKIEKDIPVLCFLHYAGVSYTVYGHLLTYTTQFNRLFILL